MDSSKPRQNDHLGVNKIGKNIRKGPLHQSNVGNSNTTRPQRQPQIYNISKNDFRSIVQQLTGSPSRESFLQPPQIPPKPQNTRLQKIRPAPLTQIHRPVAPPPSRAPPPPTQFNGILARPPCHGDSSIWSNSSESPVSLYMRYLQSSFAESEPNGNQVQPYQQHMQAQYQPQMQPSPSGSAPFPALPSPLFNGPPQPVHSFPSPRFNGAGLLPSPTSQFLLPSPSAYRMNLFSPRSPYPLFSPGAQFPPPLSPTFTFPHMDQAGVLGPGPGPGPGTSAGLMFPLSPSGFFPFPSPRWRDH